MTTANAMPVVVLISGSGSNLQALINGERTGDLPIRIVGVISNRPGVFGLERAESAGIKTCVLDHTDFTDRTAFDTALGESIDSFQPELIVLAGFMRILTEGFTRRYLGRMLNIHPSLLPKYQGLHTHKRVLDAGDNEHGVTVHFVTAELDGGPCAIQAVIPVLNDDTEQSLAIRVQQQEHVIYPLAVKWFAEQRLTMKNNAALLDNEPLPPTGYQVIAKAT